MKNILFEEDLKKEYLEKNGIFVQFEKRELPNDIGLDRLSEDNTPIYDFLKNFKDEYAYSDVKEKEKEIISKILYSILNKIVPEFTYSSKEVLSKVVYSRIGIISIYKNKNSIYLDFLSEDNDLIFKKLKGNKNLVINAFNNKSILNNKEFDDYQITQNFGRIQIYIFTKEEKNAIFGINQAVKTYFQTNTDKRGMESILGFCQNNSNVMTIDYLENPLHVFYGKTNSGKTSAVLSSALSTLFINNKLPIVINYFSKFNLCEDSLKYIPNLNIDTDSFRDNFDSEKNKDKYLKLYNEIISDIKYRKDVFEKENVTSWKEYNSKEVTENIPIKFYIFDEINLFDNKINNHPEAFQRLIRDSKNLGFVFLITSYLHKSNIGYLKNYDYKAYYSLDGSSINEIMKNSKFDDSLDITFDLNEVKRSKLFISNSGEIFSIINILNNKNNDLLNVIKTNHKNILLNTMKNYINCFSEKVVEGDIDFDSFDRTQYKTAFINKNEIIKDICLIIDDYKNKIMDIELSNIDIYEELTEEDVQNKILEINSKLKNIENKIDYVEYIWLSEQ